MLYVSPFSFFSNPHITVLVICQDSAADLGLVTLLLKCLALITPATQVDGAAAKQFKTKCILALSICIDQSGKRLRIQLHIIKTYLNRVYVCVCVTSTRWLVSFTVSRSNLDLNYRTYILIGDEGKLRIPKKTFASRRRINRKVNSQVTAGSRLVPVHWEASGLHRLHPCSLHVLFTEEVYTQKISSRTHVCLV